MAEAFVEFLVRALSTILQWFMGDDMSWRGCLLLFVVFALAGGVIYLLIGEYFL